MSAVLMTGQEKRQNCLLNCICCPVSKSFCLLIDAAYLCCFSLCSSFLFVGYENLKQPVNTYQPGTFPSIALRILAAHDLLRQRAHVQHARLFVQRVRKKHMFENKIITRNVLLTEMKSRPREHARKEGFRSISSDASSICQKTSSELFLVIDILLLVHCFKICFNYVLLFPTESTVN